MQRFIRINFIDQDRNPCQSVNVPIDKTVDTTLNELFNGVTIQQIAEVGGEEESPREYSYEEGDEKFTWLQLGEVYDCDCNCLRVMLELEDEATASDHAFIDDEDAFTENDGESDYYNDDDDDDDDDDSDSSDIDDDMGQSDTSEDDMDAEEDVRTLNHTGDETPDRRSTEPMSTSVKVDPWATPNDLMVTRSQRHGRRAAPRYGSPPGSPPGSPIGRESRLAFR